MNLSNNLIVNKSKPLIGMIRIPGDKSISHRSIILGSISSGILKIRNFLNSDDCLATVSAMKLLGADITFEEDEIIINGLGLDGLKQPDVVIDAGNSGTLIRLLSGVLVSQKFTSTLTGDDSLRKRPMARIIDPLVNSGAKIASNNDKAPIVIDKCNGLSPIRYNQSIASAQVKSCLILAALFIKGESTFYEKTPTRDHTENLLQHFNYKIDRSENSLSFEGRQTLIAKDIEIGSDISSAAFFIVAALIVDGSELLFRNVNINIYRTGLITVLKNMGGNITISNTKLISNELVGDIRVKYSNLQSINIDGDIIPSLIDELPILFIACALAAGKSIISGIEELRHKESDRIKSMEEGLKSIGIDVNSTEDSIEITGGKIMGGKIKSYGDHRIAMSFAIAGLVAQKSITIIDTKNIATSFPTFISLLREQGVEIFEV